MKIFDDPVYGLPPGFCVVQHGKMSCIGDELPFFIWCPDLFEILPGDLIRGGPVPVSHNIIHWHLIIIPFAPEGVVRTGMYVYAGLITVMMWSALMQKDWMWGIGAILFVFSDSVIAINKFVSPVPDERFLIMATYYAAQLLIFVRACPAFQPSRSPV